eukprot:scaffold8542_cov76-Skeletonema_dohrnii-CCMP3373.AAC.4
MASKYYHEGDFGRAFEYLLDKGSGIGGGEGVEKDEKNGLLFSSFCQMHYIPINKETALLVPHTNYYTTFQSRSSEQYKHKKCPFFLWVELSIWLTASHPE